MLQKYVNNIIFITLPLLLNIINGATIYWVYILLSKLTYIVHKVNIKKNSKLEEFCFKGREKLVRGVLVFQAFLVFLELFSTKFGQHHHTTFHEYMDGAHYHNYLWVNSFRTHHTRSHIKSRPRSRSAVLISTPWSSVCFSNPKSFKNEYVYKLNKNTAFWFNDMYVCGTSYFNQQNHFVLLILVPIVDFFHFFGKIWQVHWVWTSF